MLDKQDLYRVMLPANIYQQATDKEQFQKLVLKYMQRYPHYEVKSVKNGFAVCTRRESLENG